MINVPSNTSCFRKYFNNKLRTQQNKALFLQCRTFKYNGISAYLGNTNPRDMVVMVEQNMYFMQCFINKNGRSITCWAYYFDKKVSIKIKFKDMKF